MSIAETTSSSSMQAASLGTQSRHLGIVLMMALAWACAFCPAAVAQTSYNLGFTTGTTGTTVLWNTTTTWNPVGTPGASDTIAISQDLLGRTNIDYATGSSGTVSITSISVNDTNAGTNSGAFVSFRPGVAGSALQFATTSPTVSTNIINQNSGGQIVAIDNPLFQAGSTFTKGGVGNVQLVLTSATSRDSFSTNVTSLSGGGGTLLITNNATGTATLPNVSFSGTATRLFLSGGTFTATGKSIALGTQSLYLGSNGVVTFDGGSSLTGASIAMAANNSGDFYLGGSSTLTNNGGALSVTNFNIGENANQSGTYIVNQQSGTLSISGAAYLGSFVGNFGNNNRSQNYRLNVSGGLMEFTRASSNADFHVGRIARGSGTGILTQTATATISSGTVNLGSLTRIVIGEDNSGTVLADSNSAALVLSGGLLRTGREIARGTLNAGGGADQARVFLNGGTLQATAAIANLFTGFSGTTNDGVFVSSGGAVIDTGAFAVGVSGTLLADPSSAGGGLTKLGSGTLTLSGSTGYTGVTTLSAGVLAVGSANALAGGGNLAFGGGALQFSASNQADYSARIKSSTGPVSIDTNAQAVTFASDIDSTNVGGLTKLGTGTLALTAANTYSGTTTISAGALSIGSGGTSGSVAGPIANAGTLIVNRSDAVTLANAISGAGAIIVRGTGPLTLSEANTSTGNTTLESGASVSLGAGSSIGSGALAFSGPALPSLNLGGNSQTVSSFAISSATAAYSSPLVTNGAFTISTPGSGLVSWGNQPVGTVYDFSGLTSFAYTGTARPVRFLSATSGTNSMRLAAGSNTFALSSLQVGGGPDANANNSFELLLGQANTFNLGAALSVGYYQGRGVIQFQTGLSSPTVRFRGADGGEDTRLPLMTIGYTNSGATSGGGTVDLTAGTVDAKVTDLRIGESVLNTVATSSLLMSSGTVDASTIVIGFQTANGNANAQTASLVQSGGLVVAPAITLGNNTGTAAGAPRFVVAYNLSGGTLRAGSFVSGTGSVNSTSSRTLAWTGGTIANLDAATDLTIEGTGTGTATGLLAITLGGTGAKTLAPTVGRTITVGTNALVSSTGGLTVDGPGTVVLSGSNSYSGGTVVAAGTLRAGGANAFGSGAVTLASGATLDLNALSLGNAITNNGGTVSNAASYAGAQTVSGSSLFGNLGGSLTVAGGGVATFTGAMTGSVTINNSGVATLASTGTLGSGAVVLAGGRLDGIGTVVGGLSGAGSIDPGNSPGILTAGFVNPTGGLDFNFEFQAAGAPNWANAAASLNDVQRLIDATPFSATLTSANVINVYLDVASIAPGATFQGGFFTDTATDFASMVADATYNVYYRGDGQGSAAAYGGTNYYLLETAGVPGVTGVTRSTVQVPSADFAGGTVTNGYTMQFVVVPEPGSLALAGMGAATLAWLAIRRRSAGAR